MMFVVCYDISEDRTRDRLATKLLDLGSRIQESVYEACLDEEGFGRMIERIGKVPLADTDRVRIYQVCQKCAESVQIYGPGELTRDPEFYLV